MKAWFSFIFVDINDSVEDLRIIIVKYFSNHEQQHLRNSPPPTLPPPQTLDEDPEINTLKTQADDNVENNENNKSNPDGEEEEDFDSYFKESIDSRAKEEMKLKTFRKNSETLDDSSSTATNVSNSSSKPGSLSVERYLKFFLSIFEVASN